MTWLKVDDKLTFHAKIIRARNAAVGAWVRMGAWCAERESDGVIPADVVELIASPAELAKLLEVELLHAHPDGSYEIHDYLKYNPSHAELVEQRAEWARRRGQDRRKASRQVSHSDTRECLTERPAETPGTGTGSGSLDPETEKPEGDSHRASGARLKSVPPPPPESIEPPEPAKPESGYDMARRVFDELWAAKYRRRYPFDEFEAGPKSEKRVLQQFGLDCQQRAGPRAEDLARHLVKAYLRDHGDRNWLDENSHPLRTLRRDLAKYGEPPTGKHRVAARATSPPEAPPLSVAVQAERAKALAQGIGKIGMGGGR